MPGPGVDAMKEMPDEKDRSSEHEVLLGGLRSDRAKDGRIRELLRRGLDWEYLRRTALRHGVFPLLVVRLQELGRDLAPREEMARLRDLYAANFRRNLVLTAELLKLLELFQSRGIEAIPLKGPVLAAQAYGDIALRRFDDIDVMVRRKDVARAGALLAEHGYERAPAFTRAQEKAAFKRANEYTFSSRNGNCLFDVHWEFAADYLKAGFRAEDAFGALTRAELEGRPVSVLAADDTLLFLCLHGAFHVWSKLSAICDVARHIEASRGLDWPGLLRKAEARGLRRAFLLGVLLARDFFAAKAPASLVEAAGKDRVISRLRAEAGRKLFARNGEEPGFLETARFQLLLKDGFPDRLGYCLIRAFFPTAEDWRTASLPDHLYFLYFFVRVLRLSGMTSLKKMRNVPL
jgi:Uncharacterised nucleotidyltransferase